MALSRENNKIAENLLEHMSKRELEDLIEVLQYFNNHCREDVRHLCLKNGCMNETAQETRLRTIEEMFTETRKSQDTYLSAGRPVCKLCGR